MKIKVNRKIKDYNSYYYILKCLMTGNYLIKCNLLDFSNSNLEWGSMDERNDETNLELRLEAFKFTKDDLLYVEALIKMYTTKYNYKQEDFQVFKYDIYEQVYTKI